VVLNKAMKKIKTLILDGKTVEKLAGIKESINAVERAFKLLGKGKTNMPSKLYLPLTEFDGDFRAMPAWVSGMKNCGIKWVNVHPRNRQKGLPTVMALVVLNDPKTGFPVCIMDATCLSALRTGASGGVAAKYLARSDSKTVSLIGCGVQAKTQLLALCEIFSIEKVKVWGPKPNEAKEFVRGLKKLRGTKIEVNSTVKACVEASDIIVTTTPSRKPIIRLEWVKKGAHINAIGADAKGKQELDPRILKRAKIVVDDMKQASHSGEINVPIRKGKLSRKDIYAGIGEIVTRRKKGRTKNTEITVFDSTGLAVQDIAVANLIYRRARRLKKGKFLNLMSL